MTKTIIEKAYDLEERTARLGETVIGLCKTFKQDTISKSIISQLIRSSTSIDANYMKANTASSKKDFKTRYICKRKLRKQNMVKNAKRSHTLKIRGCSIIVERNSGISTYIW